VKLFQVDVLDMNGIFPWMYNFIRTFRGKYISLESTVLECRLKDLFPINVVDIFAIENIIET